jgi:hypothetical protein
MSLFLLTFSSLFIKDSPKGKAALRKHLIHTNTKVIGYIRKSATKNEKKANRIKCMEIMKDKVVERCFATKVYASSCADADSLIMNRDKKNNTLVKGAAGNMQG